MALLFDNASSERASVATAMATVVPVTMAAWFYHDEAAGPHVVISLDDSDVANMRWSLDITATHVVRAMVQAGGSAHGASSTAGGTINTWHHAAAVFENATSRAAYLDGANKGTEAAGDTPTGLDRTTVGARHNGGTPTEFFSGRIAEAACWNVVLTDAEIALLAKGFSPLFIQPTALIAYWPLNRASVNQGVGNDQTRDRWRNQHHLTEVNTPVVADHTRIYEPVGNF